MNKAFEAAAAKIKSKTVHVIGLGCGGGQKDARLLKLLKARGKEIFYTPCDVSAAMVLVARQAALAVLPEKNCFPFVCDLATADDLPPIFDSRLVITIHLVTFFGMIPNFEPQEILPKLASLIRPKDFLLFSANLAPGKNYAAGMKKILPQYDNAPTRDWLMTFLLDLGVEKSDGELRFEIAAGNFALKRFVANFHFNACAANRSCRRRISISRPANKSVCSFPIATRRNSSQKSLAGTNWKFAGDGLRNPGKKVFSFAVENNFACSVEPAARRSARSADATKLSACPARP